MEASRTLWEYAEYVRRIRCYRKEMGIEAAVERTITECIAEGILKEFLIKNRAEAKAVSIYEYNEEEYIRMEREDAFRAGIEQQRINTRREKERADTEKQRADEAVSKVKDMETELRNLRERIKQYEK